MSLGRKNSKLSALERCSARLQLLALGLANVCKYLSLWNGYCFVQILRTVRRRGSRAGYDAMALGGQVGARTKGSALPCVGHCAKCRPGVA